MAADEIPNSLYKVFVKEEPGFGQPARFDIPKTIWPQFHAKMWLYREAAILMVLLSQAQKEKNYEDVLKLFEKRIFSPHPTPDGMVKLEAVKEAIRVLNKLVNESTEQKEFSWALSCLNGIGHTKTNPVVLALFSLNRMNFYSAVAKSVKELTPQTIPVPENKPNYKELTQKALDQAQFWRKVQDCMYWEPMETSHHNDQQNQQGCRSDERKDLKE